jgi:hypothetical protein
MRQKGPAVAPGFFCVNFPGTSFRPGVAVSVSTPKQQTAVDSAESQLALLCKIAQD